MMRNIIILVGLLISSNSFGVWSVDVTKSGITAIGNGSEKSSLMMVSFNEKISCDDPLVIIAGSYDPKLKDKNLEETFVSLQFDDDEKFYVKDPIIKHDKKFVTIGIAYVGILAHFKDKSKVLISMVSSKDLNSFYDVSFDLDGSVGSFESAKSLCKAHKVIKF